MGLSEIIGHQKQIETLRSALMNGRLHHAYLFAGPEGVGKRKIAFSFAKVIHCSETPGDFCNGCANCARIDAGNHPDVRFLEPLAGKKEISIQQIRDIEKELNFRSFSGKRKVAVIDPATLMNLSAQNALLKTLEEPPQDSLLILIASNAGGLLPTLRSRCLRISFNPLDEDSLARFLVSNKSRETDGARLLAAMAMGSLGAALRLDNEKLRERRSRWIGLLSLLVPGDYRAAADAAEELAANRDESLQFLEWVESWYRDLLVHGATQNSQAVINQDSLTPIRELSGKLHTERILSALDRIAEAGWSIQRNLNRRMVLEQFFFSVVRGD
jgi:DNA polymerase-3 subunit delta'